MPETPEEKQQKANQLALILQSRGNPTPIPSELVGTAGQDSILSQYQQNQSGFDESGVPNIVKYNPAFGPNIAQTVEGFAKGNSRQMAQGVIGSLSKPVSAFAGPLTGMALSSAGQALSESLPSHGAIDTSHVDLKSAFGSEDFNRLSLTDQKKTLAKGIPGLDSLSDSDYAAWRESEGSPIKNFKQHTIFDTALNIARPIIDASVAGLTSKIPGLGPLASKIIKPAVYTATDAIAQKIQNNAPSSLLSQILGIEPGTIADTLLSTGEQAGVGKILDKVIPAVGKKLNAAVNSDEVLQTLGVTKKQLQDFDKLQPTFSQYYQKLFGTTAKLPQVVEDTFNSTVKNKLALSAAKKAEGKLFTLANPEELNTDILAKDVAAMTEENLHKSVEFSNLNANLAKEIGDQNPVSFLTSQAPGEEPNVVKVNGPIRTFETRQAIQDITNGLEPFGDAPDPTIGTMKSILGHLNKRVGEVDQHGESIPLSFDEAWKLAQVYSKIGYKSAKGAEVPTFMDSNYRKLWKSMTNDISNSIPTWEEQTNNPGKAPHPINNPTASQSWEFSKQAVRDRHAIFGEGGVYDLINEPNSKIPYLDAGLKDVNKLRFILNASELRLPNGTVEMTNARRNVAGYALNKLIEDSVDRNPVNLGLKNLNSDKFSQKWNDPEFQNVKDELFNKDTQKAVQEVISNLSAMQQGKGTANRGIQMRFVGGGIALAGGITQGLTHSFPYSAGVTMMGLSGIGLAKLLSNPTTAKIMIAMSKGKPLNTSQENVSRIVGHVLNGTIVNLISPDGSESPAKVEDGKLVPH